jgi:aspartate 1-decarboxylase
VIKLGCAVLIGAAARLQHTVQNAVIIYSYFAPEVLSAQRRQARLLAHSIRNRLQRRETRRWKWRAVVVKWGKAL